MEKGVAFMEEDRKDIKSLCALLTRENKQYVIAVANALLFFTEKSGGDLQDDCWE